MVSYYKLFNICKGFNCKIEGTHVFSCSIVKVTKGFPAISNLVVTTRIAINYTRADFFLSTETLKRSKLLSLHLDLKFTFSLQCGKFPIWYIFNMLNLRFSDVFRGYRNVTLG